MNLNKESEIIKSKFLETCDIEIEKFKVEPFSLVIFGGAGDLSKRKLLPTIFYLYSQGELPDEFSVIGFGLPELSDEEYKKVVKEATFKFYKLDFDVKKWQEFSKHLFYISGSFDNQDAYHKLCERVSEVTPSTSGKKIALIYYMAVPPNFMPIVVQQLKNLDLCKGKYHTKVIVEKPFGRDKESAVQLSKFLNEAFDEDQIYRIDHYLGKNTVQDIIFFRFSNSIFEPLWNRRYIDHIQITVAEGLGVEHRGSFYEQAGVVRDIVQNHIMQLIGLVAMEPPSGFEADLIRDEKVKVFRSLRVMDDESIDAFTVRGQYGKGSINNKEVISYRSENNVDPGSNTPTFFAAKFFIDNWRWAGVPFYIRTGKRLAKRSTHITVEFKQPPLKLFGRSCEGLEPNLLVLSIQPQEKISLRFGVRKPTSSSQIFPVNMEFNYQNSFGKKPQTPYQRLLIDCMKGDLTLFVRQDGVEAMWAVIDPINKRWESNPAEDFPNYRSGSWGPVKGDELIKCDGRSWNNE